MDVQWLHRVTNANNDRLTEHPLQISLWSESGANILSLWSVLVVHGSLTSVIAIVPFGLYFGLLRWLPEPILHDFGLLIYSDIGNVITQALYCAVAFLILRHMFGSRLAWRTIIRIIIPIFLASCFLSLALHVSHETKLFYQIALDLCYFIAIPYALWEIRKQDASADPSNSVRLNALRLRDGALALMQLIILTCLGFYLAMCIFPFYIHENFYGQLYIRLGIMTGGYVLMETAQMSLLASLPTEFASRCLEITTVINGHGRFVARLMVATVNDSNYTRNLVIMCIGLTFVDVLCRTSFNIRYHFLVKIVNSLKGNKDGQHFCCSGFLGWVLQRKLGRKSYDESNGQSPAGNSGSTKKITKVNVSSVHIRPAEATVIRVRDVTEEDEVEGNSPSIQRIVSSNDLGSAAGRSEVENKIKSEDEETPFPLPSPLREMRMKQILDDMSINSRVIILVSFLLYYIHPLFCSIDFKTSANVYEVFLQIGIQLLFELATDYISLYTEIYCYKLPLDVSYDELQRFAPVAIAMSALSMSITLALFTFLVHFEYSV